MTEKSNINFYNFSPDTIAGFLIQKDWKGCWNYMRQLIGSFSVKLDQSHNISIQKGFSDEEKRKYAEQFGALMGELLYSLLTHPDARIDDENFTKLIMMHEVIHTFLGLAGLNNTDALVEDIIRNNKKLSIGQQKKVALLLSMETELDIRTIIKKLSPAYRGMTVSAYMGALKIYNPHIYNNKVKLYDVSNSLETFRVETADDLKLILSPYFSCSYLAIENKHEVKRNINKAFRSFYDKRKKHISAARTQPITDLGVTEDKTKPRILVLWEYFYTGHAMLRVWGPWVKALERDFTVLNIAEALYQSNAPEDYFANIYYYNTVSDLFRISDAFQPDMLILPSVGMSFWGITASNLSLAPTQIQLLGHPATTLSDRIDFVHGPDVVLDEAAFPTDKLLSDKLPLTYESRLTREEVAAMQPTHYQKGSGRPLKVSVIGSEIKICAPFVQLLQDIEAKSDFDIEFSLSLGTMGMDTIYAERFFYERFKNLKYYGWQPYENYLASMLEADIVLNPFPFGHTNTLIDSLILGKPCIGLQGDEPASLTEKMILQEVGLVDQFSATSHEDYKAKFQKLAEKIRNGETTFFDRMEMFDKLHAPQTIPDYSSAMKWVYDNAETMKASPRKRFEIGEPIEA